MDFFRWEHETIINIHAERKKKKDEQSNIVDADVTKAIWYTVDRPFFWFLEKRSSRNEVFEKLRIKMTCDWVIIQKQSVRRVLKRCSLNFCKIHKNTCVGVSVGLQPTTLLKKTPLQVFSYQFHKVFRTPFSQGNWATASDSWFTIHSKKLNLMIFFLNEYLGLNRVDVKKEWNKMNSAWNFYSDNICFSLFDYECQ